MSRLPPYRIVPDNTADILRQADDKPYVYIDDDAYEIHNTTRGADKETVDEGPARRRSAPGPRQYELPQCKRLSAESHKTVNLSSPAVPPTCRSAVPSTRRNSLPRAASDSVKKVKLAKCDPVCRGQLLREEWKRDSFLQ
ncbi:hypothetical protein FOL47_002137 [Perkinsus chesapeaki]|uniref:Uncharacterized protein n=1 Tax=Perkinsus chesapeaki TaxID=330153 RepID=A0A7J6MF75_PERCH|nr:hypothetical protein FOL47_002137 [Perkinsus chesapeaki]